MTDPILHHYDFSNFSEKIRLIFGLKGLAWRSVTIPSTAPKPDYEPLTGGYRRTPALQLGADVICDTRLIADRLEALAPVPTLFPGGAADAERAFAHLLATWSEHRLLWPLARWVTAVNADAFPERFHADRARLHGKPVPDRAQVKASAARNLAQLRAELPQVAALVPRDRAFLRGEAAGLADINLYHPLWLLETLGGRSALLDAVPGLRAWMDRVAAIGNGAPSVLAPAAALDEARSAQPEAAGLVLDPDAPEGLAAGAAVEVTPLEERTAARGRLLALDDARIVIATEDERTGTVHAHFPRVGYRVRPARA